MTEPRRISIMKEAAIQRAIARMAREIVEKNDGTDSLVLMGIHRRGVQIAESIRWEIGRAEGVEAELGSIDITLYRDDLMTIGPRPVIGESELPSGGIDEKAVVIVDDVLYTGRTTRAALDELMDWGRPARIYLCVLVDRGGRELPVQPDIVGKRVQILKHQQVRVVVPEIDGRWAVEIVEYPPERA